MQWRRSPLQSHRRALAGFGTPLFPLVTEFEIVFRLLGQNHALDCGSRRESAPPDQTTVPVPVLVQTNRAHESFGDVTVRCSGMESVHHLNNLPGLFG
jgi:hypothetical protein